MYARKLLVLFHQIATTVGVDLTGGAKQLLQQQHSASANSAKGKI